MNPLVVGSSELGPFLEKEEVCPNCGAMHKVETWPTTNKSMSLNTVRCDDGNSYLVGVDRQKIAASAAGRG